MGDEVMTGQPLLQVNSVETYYGNIRALVSVDVHVNKGEIVSLIGANGAKQVDTDDDDLRQPAGPHRFGGLRGPRHHPHADA